MNIWTSEIQELEDFLKALSGKIKDLESELSKLVKATDDVMALLYARRSLEVIVSDLCISQLNRPRGNEPLKGIIDKLAKDEIVPSYISSSMLNLNSHSTFGAHPKDFDPRQVRTALIELATIMQWYIHNKNLSFAGNLAQFESVIENPHGLIVSHAKKQAKHITLIPNYNTDLLIGRDNVLENIHDQLIKSTELLIISGMGGIGKTSLALAYVNSGQYNSNYDNISWVTVADNLRDCLINEFSKADIGFTFDPNSNPETNFEKLLYHLKRLEGKNLLVIDNADNPDEIIRIKDSLESLRWKILVTSRTALSLNLLNIDTLSKENARILFYRYFQKEKNDEILDKILDSINCHTLLIELLAKASQVNRRMTINGLYQLVNEANFKNPGLQAKIDIGKHGLKKNFDNEQQLFQYLLMIFDIGNLEKKEIDYLRYFSLFPVGEIDVDILFDFFQVQEGEEIEFDNTLNSLVKKGWINVNNVYYQAHPLMQSVLFEKLNPTIEDCQQFIKVLVNKLNIERKDKLIDKKQFIPFAESILHKFKEEHHLLAELANKLSKLYRKTGDYQKSLEFGSKAIEIGEKILDKNDLRLADYYYNLGNTCEELNQIEKYLEFGLKTLSIRENQLTNHPDLGDSYTNIGYAYRKLGNFEKALEFGFKAVDIYKNCSDDPSLLALAFNNICKTYRDSLNYSEAVNYALKALELRKDFLDENHVDLATSYSDIATIYRNMGEFGKAIEYATVARNKFMVALGEKHAYVAYCDWILADTYFKMNELNKAKTFVDEAVAIQSESYPIDHPYLKNNLELQSKINNAL